MTRRGLLSVSLLSAVFWSGCGYHVGGKADLIPKGIQTIAIPSFTTYATSYKLGDQLPQQIGREFMARTRFRIVNDPSQADAVLNGNINLVRSGPSIFDPTTNRASAVLVLVSLNVTLRERATGRVLYSRFGWVIRETYEIASDPHQFIDESGPALDRLSRDVARDVVSAVVENF